MRDTIQNKFSGIYGELMILRQSMWAHNSKCSRTQKDDIIRLTDELRELQSETVDFIDSQEDQIRLLRG
ncbi:hypothetical protein KX729_00225 [Rhizobium sp. XQZ8]|uniref:hypothetical protein n=1 Tax=Rhizobium populisoli TaxID=2859785 RepID=UPI001CA47FC7|nr:hypothetical protein [Rhizobium populisoli]MBW6419860.1 hypothetical protein [Rhizobium populisoli]